MPGFLKDWVLNIVSLMVFITVIDVLVPGGKFKKYIQLVTGTLVVIAIVTPFAGLAGKDFNFPEFQLKNTVLMERTSLEKQKENMKEAQFQQIAAEYKKKLTEQIRIQVQQIIGEKKSCRVEVDINETNGNERFGEVLQVRVRIDDEKKDDDSIAAIRIERIEIGNQKAEVSPPENRNPIDGKLSSAIKAKVAGFIGISADSIQVY